MPFDVDVNAIDDRLRQLALFDQATCYSKQKASLQRELENFLSSLPGSINYSFNYYTTRYLSFLGA